MTNMLEPPQRELSNGAAVHARHMSVRMCVCVAVRHPGQTCRCDLVPKSHFSHAPYSYALYSYGLYSYGPDLSM